MQQGASAPSTNNQRYIGASLQNQDWAGQDLRGQDFSHADLSGADLGGADLRGATFYKAILDDCSLMGAQLDEANLTACSAQRAGFGGASFRKTRLANAVLTEASFVQASLREADLSAACFKQARLNGADLSQASFFNADLQHADMAECQLAGTTLDRADLRGARLRGVKGFEQASWYGADIRDVDFCGAYLVRRHIQDENYLWEFRNRNKLSGFVYKIWLWTSDCGRSLTRWSIWTGLITILFAGLYSIQDIDYGINATTLSPLLYSVAILTALGYADVLPTSNFGQFVVLVEVLAGYFALGGLLSIFSNKMARRAE